MLFLTPLGKLVGASFADNAYQRVLEDPLVLRALVNTLTISLASTIVTVVLGYIIAMVLWRAGNVTRVILFAVVLLPFWTGILVKNFAWAVLLQDNGIVNAFLQGIGLTGCADPAAAQPVRRDRRHGALPPAVRGVPDLLLAGIHR